MVIQIILFYIFLPTADVFTDLLLIYKLYMGSFIGEAIALFIPFSLNYIFTLGCWILSKEKTRTLIFPLLIIYPQFCKFIQTFFQRSCFNLITRAYEHIFFPWTQGMFPFSNLNPVPFNPKSLNPSWIRENTQLQT